MTKNPTRIVCENHHIEDKKEGQRKAKKSAAYKNQRRERTNLFVLGNYLTYSPFNLACMQIVKSNTNRRFRTNISYQHNLPFYNKS